MSKGSRDMFLSSLQQYISAQPGVSDVTTHYGNPVSHAQLLSWERTNHVTLPNDVQQFYLSHDGASLVWKYNFNRRSITLGNINIRPLSELDAFKPFTSCTSASQPSLCDLQDATKEWNPYSSLNNIIIIFNDCSSCGYTCLAFDEDSSFKGVWLIDLALDCHLISDTFSDYLRLCQVHLGLLQWPYSLNVGNSNEYKVWFEIFIPTRLAVDYNCYSEDSLVETPSSSSSTASLQFTKPNFELFTSKHSKSLK